jgi:hypothetical protein
VASVKREPPGSDLTQSKTTFWERQGDMVLVHHFAGVSDHVETLSNKKITRGRTYRFQFIEFLLAARWIMRY